MGSETDAMSKLARQESVKCRKENAGSSYLTLCSWLIQNTILSLIWSQVLQAVSYLCKEKIRIIMVTGYNSSRVIQPYCTEDLELASWVTVFTWPFACLLKKLLAWQGVLPSCLENAGLDDPSYTFQTEFWTGFWFSVDVSVFMLHILTNRNTAVGWVTGDYFKDVIGIFMLAWVHYYTQTMITKRIWRP